MITFTQEELACIIQSLDDTMSYELPQEDANLVNSAFVKMNELYNETTINNCVVTLQVGETKITGGKTMSFDEWASSKMITQEQREFLRIKIDYEVSVSSLPDTPETWEAMKKELERQNYISAGF